MLSLYLNLLKKILAYFNFQYLVAIMIITIKAKMYLKLLVFNLAFVKVIVAIAIVIILNFVIIKVIIASENFIITAAIIIN